MPYSQHNVKVFHSSSMQIGYEHHKDYRGVLFNYNLAK